MIEKWDAFPLLYSQRCVNITKAISYSNCIRTRSSGIEHRPPEAGAAVRIRPGVYFFAIFDGNL